MPSNQPCIGRRLILYLLRELQAGFPCSVSCLRGIPAMINDSDILIALRRIALLGKSDGKEVIIPRAAVRDLVKLALHERFDEAWYLDKYKDVAEAVRKGGIASGFEHYASTGIYEGRIPYPLAIDEPDYLERHRDVARSLAKGPYTSAADHFYAVGFLENRTFQLASAKKDEKGEVRTAAQ